jgi:hypothetical protein
MHQLHKVVGTFFTNMKFGNMNEKRHYALIPYNIFYYDCLQLAKSKYKSEILRF